MLSTYIWKRGILSGGKDRAVSRNLQADRYMSSSFWRNRAPFLPPRPPPARPTALKIEMEGGKRVRTELK